MSSSADKKIIVWLGQDDLKDRDNWKIIQKIQDAHDQSINFLTVLNVNNLDWELYFSSISIDGTLNFWQNTD